MVKVTYNGHFPECSIKLGDALVSNWKRGEVKELSEDEAKLLTNNKQFIVNGEVKEEPKVIEEVVEEEPIEEPEEEVIEEIYDEEPEEEELDEDFEEEIQEEEEK